MILTILSSLEPLLIAIAILFVVIGMVIYFNPNDVM